MRKYGKCLSIIMFGIIVLSCSWNQNQQTTPVEENKAQTPVRNRPTQSPKIIKKVTVRAEVFHFIDNLDGTGSYKDAHRKEDIVIDVYENGEMYLSKGLLSIVRYSRLSGYEYECNIHNDIWAFNYDDAINIENINNY